MLFSEVQPIFSEADAADTLFLFTVFGDKKSKSLRGSSGLGIIEVKFTKAQFEFEKMRMVYTRILYQITL